MNFNSNINNEELKNLPVKYFNGKIIIIDTLQKLNTEIKELKNTDILGFDTETKPTFIKGKKNANKVALLQLSTEDKAYLIRLNKIGLPDEIAELLSTDRIKKIGVAIKDDIKSLNKLTPFTPRLFIDLAEYSKYYKIEANGLKKLAGIVLNHRISKNQQLSNWEKETLTHQQIRYAATDAWVCIKIYNTLSKSFNKCN